MWDNIVYVWEQLLAFFDRSFQWLKFLFNGNDESWNPEDYENPFDGIFGE